MIAPAVPFSVIPAKAGIQSGTRCALKHWTLACAGVTR